MFAGKKIVFVGGAWDLFHVGHLRILKRAKPLGDTMVVGVSSDELVYRYKGMSPIIPLLDRMSILRSLSVVDFVVEQKELADPTLLQKCGVDVFVSGSDWQDKSAEEEPEGYAWIRENLSMVFLPRTPNISSSSIKQELNKRNLL